MNAPAFGRVAEPWWNDGPVFVVGAGPSVAPYYGRLAELMSRGRVVCANPGGQKARFPDCHAVVSIDINWITKRRDDLARFSGEVFCGVKDNFSFQRAGLPHVTYLRRAGYTNGALCLDGVSVIGGNSGHAALDVAQQKDAREIYLLGMDFKMTDRTHGHEGYPGRKPGRNDNNLKNWRKQVDRAIAELRDRGVRVVNASLDSALTQAPVIDPKELFR